MIKKDKNIFRILFAIFIGATVVVSCEPEADDLGSQFFQNGAQGTESSYDIVIFNKNNK